MKLEPHPLCSAFPRMPDEDLKALADDIKERGQYQTILLYEGKILDGLNRYNACLMAGKEPRVMDYKGKDPRGLVRSNNKHRRHMTASQWAAAEVLLSAWRSPGRNKCALSAHLNPTTEQMAASAGVSKRTIVQAKTVVSRGSDELKQQVVEGKVSVREAAESLKPKKPKKKKEPKADPRDARIAALESELETATENLPELSHLAASAEAFKDKKEFTDMVALRAELDATRRRRDELMTENAELKKTVGYWKRRAEKAEKQIATLEARIAELEKEVA